MLVQLVTIIFLASFQTAESVGLERIFASELFSTMIEPRLFNWTFQGSTEQFKYRPSLQGHPDLPGWIQYQYSREYHAGFLYGTPPENEAGKEIKIEIIALNRQNYETRSHILTLQIVLRQPTTNLIHMKIDSLDWVNLLDPGRVENLKNIFRKDLWPESAKDLKVVFMESAVKMGARLPLRPQQREGVVVHLGSNAPFSVRLLELQEEIRPLYKISSCTYKRTSVQNIFENSGFKLDWCAFRLVGEQNVMTQQQDHFNSPQDGNKLRFSDRWDSISLEEVPDKNYADELAFALAIPGIILTLLLTMLAVVLCFQHEKFDDEDSELFFYKVFDFFSIYFPRTKRERRIEPQHQANVTMVQYSDSNRVQTTTTTTTTLKSLKDPMYTTDDMSFRSSSPTSTLYCENSPRMNFKVRPEPPPYKPASSSIINYPNGVEI